MSDNTDDDNNEAALGDYLQLESPRSYDPAMLTYANREFLYHRGSYAENSRSTQRKRVRDRVHNAILDFDYLRSLQVKDRRLIFEGVNEESDLYNGIKEMLLFVYTGLREETTVDFEILLEDVIFLAERRLGMDVRDTELYNVTGVDVSVDIQKDRVILEEDVKKKALNGEELTDEELGVLYRASLENDEFEDALESYKQQLNKEPDDSAK